MWIVIISGCLYALLLKEEIQWKSLLLAQSIVSLFICMLKNDWKGLPSKKSYLLGVLYLFSSALPLWLLVSGLIDYGHATLVRVCSVIFPALWNYKNIKWIPTLLMIVSLLLGKLAVDTQFWPHISWGIILAIISGFFSSLLGILQEKWNPYSMDAFGMNLTATILMYLFTEHFQSVNILLLIVHGIQTWAINDFFLTGAKSSDLGLILAFRKILFVVISTKWSTMNWYLYIPSVLIAWYGLVF